MQLDGRTDGTRDDVTIFSSLNQGVQGGKPMEHLASQGTVQDELKQFRRALRNSGRSPNLVISAQGNTGWRSFETPSV